MSDLLDRATRSLRERDTAAAAEEAGDLGRRRLEQALTGRGQRRTRLRGFVLLLAASFIALSALASRSVRLRQWIRGGSPEEVSEVSPRTPTVSSSRSFVLPPQPEAVAQDASTAPADDAPTTSTPPRASRVVPSPAPSPPSPPRSAPQSAPSPLPPEPSPAADVDALYRAAHDAQFARHDPQAALVAWDRYLAAAGASGSMAPEARYNRGITLVRLGRAVEARAALEPFARGEYGGYRREDAARVLESLSPSGDRRGD